MANGFSLFGDAAPAGFDVSEFSLVEPLEFPDFSVGSGPAVVEPSIWGSIFDKLPGILTGIGNIVNPPQTQSGQRSQVPIPNQPTVVVAPGQIPQRGTQQGGFVPGFALPQPSFYDTERREAGGILGMNTQTLLLVGGGAVLVLFLVIMR